MAQTTNLGIDSADAEFFYGIEQAGGLAPTAFTKLLINDITQAGATITTTEDEPLGAGNQRRKGRTTGLESGFSFNGNIRKGQFVEFAGSFLKSEWNNQEIFSLDADIATASTFTVSNLSAAARAKLVEQKLVSVSNSGNSVNNGIHEITGTSTSGQTTTITVSTSTMIPETGVKLSSCGYRFAAGDISDAAYSGSTNKLTVTTGSAVDFATQGLVVGQRVFFGSPSATTAGFNNAFTVGSSTNAGYGEALYEGSNSANTVHTFGWLPTRMRQANLDEGSGDIDILFSRSARNRLKTDSEYELNCYQMGVKFPGLTGASPAGDSYEFMLGNVCNTLSASFTPGQFATYTVGMVGTDTDVNLRSTDPRATLVDNAGEDLESLVYSCATDFGRLRFIDLDENGLSSIFESMTFSLGNNVTPKNVLGVLGAERLNQGRFDCSMEGQLIYTAPDLKDFIRENVDVAGSWTIANDDGLIAIDIPSVTLANGQNAFPRNDAVNITLTGTAHADNRFDRTVLISTIDTPIEGNIREAV